jgi:hypothetical protein
MSVSTRAALGCVAVVLLTTMPAASQTSTPGPAIDVEIYNPGDGTNLFCAAPGDTVAAYVWVSPAVGSGSSLLCFAPCGIVDGGPAHLAAATLDVGFDPSHLAFYYAFSNGFPGSAAADGLIQLHDLAAA